MSKLNGLAAPVVLALHGREPLVGVSCRHSLERLWLDEPNATGWRVALAVWLGLVKPWLRIEGERYGSLTPAGRALAEKLREEG